MTRSRSPKSARQTRLETLAHEAWPGQSLEVIAPDEGAVHIWDERGRALLHVEHPLADEVLGMLARKLGVMSIGVAVDATEHILRTRAAEDGIAVAGMLAARVELQDGAGHVVATGASLREAIANMDRRQPSMRPGDELTLPAAVRVSTYPRPLPGGDE